MSVDDRNESQQSQQSSLVKKVTRALWKGSANASAASSGLVAAQDRIVRLMAYLPPIEKQSPAMGRMSYRVISMLFGGDLLAVAEVKDEVIHTKDGADLKARIYVPHDCQDSADSAGLVYYHGGGCVIGSLDTHDDVCRLVASNNQCVVVSIDYRLAPEFPYPLPLEDAIHGWNWVCEQTSHLGLDSRRIGVGGDSAGGLLATTICHQYQQASLGVAVAMMPAFQWLIYPWVDGRMSTQSSQRCTDGMMLTSTTMAFFIEKYLGGEVSKGDPSVSPILLEDLRGLPPTYIATAGFDPLEDEGRTYSNRLIEAGVNVTDDHFADVMHGFIGFSGVCPTSKRYLKRMITQLDALMANAS